MAKPSSPAADTPRRSLSLGGQLVGYQLLRTSRRSVGLSIGPTGLRVSAPRWVLVGEIDRLLMQKSAWILEKLAEQQTRLAQAQALAPVWCAGLRVAHLGRGLRLCAASSWPAEAPRMARHGQAWGDQLFLPVPADAPAQAWEAACIRWFKGQALLHFEQRCKLFAQHMGVSPSRIALSQARTRWGSANSRGQVRLNWRLLHLDPALLDYVVVHELAHLREMNHSPRFWAVVAAVLPDYLSLRRRLREISLAPGSLVSLADSPPLGDCRQAADS